GQARQITAALAQRGAPLRGRTPAADLAAVCDQAVGTLEAGYDTARGGFGQAPKFPPSMVLEFLLPRSARPGADGGRAGARPEAGGPPRWTPTARARRGCSTPGPRPSWPRNSAVTTGGTPRPRSA